VYLPQDQEIHFVATHINIKNSLGNINIGDILVIGEKEEPKRQVVFMGLNSQSKMILHELGKNYKLDICVEEKDYPAMIAVEETEQQLVKVQQKRESQETLPAGIKTTNSNSFISSLLPILR